MHLTVRLERVLKVILHKRAQMQNLKCIPNVFQTHPKHIPNASQTHPKRIPNASQTHPKRVSSKNVIETLTKRNILNGFQTRFKEKYHRNPYNNRHFTVKRPQPGPPEDFQPIRNRSFNKEMNVRTSRETVIFF